MRLSSLALPLLLLLVACGGEPPAPLPEVRQTSHSSHVLHLPIVATSPPMQGWARAYSDLTNAEMKKLGIEWYYDYNLRYPLPHRAGAEYVPFLWCDIYPSLAYGKAAIRYFDALQKLPPDYSGYLLFLNEPDLPGSIVDGGQCERTPRQAAYMLKATRELCPGCVLVGPVVSHKDYFHGWPWLTEFYREARAIGVRLPEVSAIHTYLDEDPQLIIDSHFRLLRQFPGAATTAWVTEFASADPAQVERMIATYQADPRIERYAWFTARGWRAEMSLIDGAGRLTPVGEVWSGGRISGGAAYP